jgi:hypothetical protein
MPRCSQFWEDGKEPSAGLMGLRGPHLPASCGAREKLGDTARAENWRNPGGANSLGPLSASHLSHSPSSGMLLRPSTDRRPKELARDMRGFFNSLLRGCSFVASQRSAPKNSRVRCVGFSTVS